MLKTEIQKGPSATKPVGKTSRVVAVWIDWYAYHVGRFRGLFEHETLRNNVFGIEMVGGVGVHAGLKFREEIPSSLPVRTLFPESNWQQAKGFKVAIALWQCLSELNPDVVLVPGYYTNAGLACALWGKVYRRRTVLMTESTEYDHSRVWWKELVKSLLIRSLFDWAVSGGKAHRRYLEQLRFPVDRVARFYDVVENEFFKERSSAIRKQFQPQDFGLPENFFLYVGRLSPEKNIENLVAAYLEYRRTGGTWALLLVGDGPLAPKLRETAMVSLFTSDIYFEGLRSTSELPQYYAFAGCFVLPSTREPWGLVANEAMASGLPVVISNRCGCAEDLLAEGQNGYSFDPSNTNDLVECLKAISGMEPRTRLEFGRKSAQIISEFSPENWANEIARIAGA